MSEETKISEEETVVESTEASSEKSEVSTSQRDDARPAGRPEKTGFQKNPRFKRKVCKFCFDKNAKIDYKNAGLLEQFITDRGKILPRRVTGTCAKHQRGVAAAIKRARIIALLPFIEK